MGQSKPVFWHFLNSERKNIKTWDFNLYHSSEDDTCSYKPVYILAIYNISMKVVIVIIAKSKTEHHIWDRKLCIGPFVEQTEG